MNKLKDLRHQVKATQKDIADLVGVSQGTIDRYESGARGVSIPMAWKLISALNSLGAKCSIADVFPDSQTNHTNSVEL